jgi:tetrapyrrole methylase family protein / MazG family protein
VAPGVTVVGLGPGDPDLLTRRALERVRAMGEVYLRTREHPALAGIPAETRVESFDGLYENADDFETVYSGIVERLIELARRPSGVVYAVPGDPSVGEATVPALREAARAAGLPFEIVPGISFLEPSLAALGLDALDGLQVADALDIAAQHHPPLSPDRPALIGQVYSSQVASDLKLTLMNCYPDAHPVVLVHHAGTNNVHLERLRLHEIDRSESIGVRTSLYIPASEGQGSLESFQETIAHLRAPDGCPWDREQTHQSLGPHLMEEAYEALHALDTDDMSALCEELGDLLLQIVIQVQIAAEEGDFLMGDVIRGINAKLARRHPHVFGDVQVSGVEQVLHNWEALKHEEREEGGTGKGLLDGVPRALPALAQAAEIQRRVARVGFDWPELDGVQAKVAEELNELLEAETEERRAAEMGDVLFAVVNYARWLGIDPEAALRTAAQRFRERFGEMEAAARQSGRSLEGLSAGEMDRLWEAAKDQE